jgi:hypothetical protein
MMPLDDPSDPSAETRRLKKRVERLEAGTADGGDSTHPGDGYNSVQLGPDAVATGNETVALGEDATAVGNYSVAVGMRATAAEFGTAVGPDSDANGVGGTAVGRATAYANYSTALGMQAYAGHLRSTALGLDANTTAADQIMLGTAINTVVVPGTFSNPSARRLKQNIIPGPCLRSIFPTQYEWEYIADVKHRRHVGPIADELVGTDAERFLTFDDDGAVAGIDKLGLYGAQITVLHQENDDLKARLTVLENLIEGLTNG